MARPRTPLFHQEAKVDKRMTSIKDEKIKNQLPASVIQLGFVSFFADIASEMLYPITPLFLTGVLGASMGSLGLIEGMAEAMASLLKTYSGAWSDRWTQRRPLILTGYFLSAISKPMIGICGNWTQVLSARLLDRTGKGLRSAPRDALIADSIDEKQRGRAFGWHRAMDTAGAILGPLIALIYLEKNPENLRPLYAWSLLPGLISVAVLLLVSEKKRIASQSTKSVGFSFSLRPFENSALNKYFLGWGLFCLTNSSDVFLLMRAKSLGASNSMVILMYCAYNLTYALASPYLGKISDHFPRRKIMSVGLFIFAMVYAGFGFANSLWQLWILFFTYGFYMACTDGVGKALVVDLCHPEEKGKVLGMFGTLTGLSTLIASTTAGLLWEHYGSRWTFTYGAIGSLLAIFFLGQMRTRTETQS